MLEQTFVHIPGLGAKMERALWSQGCHCWDDLLANLEKFSIGQASKEDARAVLEESLACLKALDHRYFMQRLGLSESWRAFPSFRGSCVYLDIETDGGSGGNSVTTVGLYDGKEYRCLIKGRDLNDLPDVLAGYGMIVTFFGAGFDLPMLQKRFKGLRLDHLHIDLCPTLRKLGHRGGLKAIEKRLGLQRSDDTDGLNGLDAIRLWNRYRTLGDEAALETLIAYNREDVVNLEHLAEYAYNGLRAVTMRGASDSPNAI